MNSKKKELAEFLVDLPGWDGLKDPEELCQIYSEEELRDTLDAYVINFSDIIYEGSPYEITPQLEKEISIYSRQEKYDRQNTKRYSIKLNRNTDTEVMAWLDKQPNKQGAIKRALKELVERETGHQ